jgi:hypothetical protein
MDPLTKKASGAFATFRIKVREYGGVFRTYFKASVASDGENFFSLRLEPYIIIPKNSDIILTAEASAASTIVSGGFNLKFAKVLD